MNLVSNLHFDNPGFRPQLVWWIIFFRVGECLQTLFYIKKLPVTCKEWVRTLYLLGSTVILLGLLAAVILTQMLLKSC